MRSPSTPVLTRPIRWSVPGTDQRQATAVGIGAVLAFLAVRLLRTGGAGGFPLAGPPATSAQAPAELHRYATSYDGQFVYRLALDPFTRAATAHGITLDRPAYRQQRIATALLAHLVADAPAIGTAVALLLVNAIAVMVAIVVGVRLATELGRSPWAGLVLAVPACLPISLGRDLTEPVAWAAVLLALLAARHERWLPAALALTVAVLARETSLVVVGGLGLEWLYQLARRRPGAMARVWLVLPVVVEAAWQGWLAHVWGGRPPILQGADDNSGAPLIGIITNFFYRQPGGAADHLLALTYLIERVTLVALLGTALYVVLARRGQLRPGEAIAWVGAALLAISLKRWADDVSFLRATYEAWGLSVFVLLCSRLRATSTALRLAGGVSVGVGLLYTVRI